MSRRALAVGFSLLLSACATATETLSGLGIPTRAGSAQVLETIQRGGYLVSTLEGERFTLSFTFPSTPECVRVLQVPGLVGYTRVGRVGDIERGATVCSANGIASLEAWRDRSARFEVMSSDGTSTYQPFFVDPAVIMVRGSFPQLSRIGWSPTRDTVVMLPRNAACDTVANATEAQLKFYPSGFPAFTLSVDDSHCAVIGVADPL